MRLVSTCSISSGSIGTSRNSSGRCTSTGISVPHRRVNLPTAPSMISSAASGVLLTLASSPPMRVMLSRFSTMRISHWASSLALRISSWHCSGVRVFSCSSSTLVAPTMPVNGVRMSWDTARRRLPCIRSSSASRRTSSICLARLVTIPVTTEMVMVTRKVNGNPDRVKLTFQ